MASNLATASDALYEYSYGRDSLRDADDALKRMSFCSPLSTP
jgi:hypothetical protein